MQKRITKRFIFLTITIFAFLGLGIINSYVIKKYQVNPLAKSLLKEPTQAVYNEILNESDKITQVFIPPYVGDNIDESISFYDQNDNEDNQKKAIIKYESTYLPSTGILYTSDDTFDVIAILDGEVVNISNDNILGNSVTIKYNDILSSTYYSLTDTNLKVGDIVMQGEILGTSTINKISNNRYALFFEVTYLNEFINPVKIYNQKLEIFS